MGAGKKLLAWLRRLWVYKLDPFQALVVVWLVALSVYTCLASVILAWALRQLLMGY